MRTAEIISAAPGKCRTTATRDRHLGPEPLRSQSRVVVINSLMDRLETYLAELKRHANARSAFARSVECQQAGRCGLGGADKVPARFKHGCGGRYRASFLPLRRWLEADPMQSRGLGTCSAGRGRGLPFSPWRARCSCSGQPTDFPSPRGFFCSFGSCYGLGVLRGRTCPPIHIRWPIDPSQCPQLLTGLSKASRGATTRSFGRCGLRMTSAW